MSTPAEILAWVQLQKERREKIAKLASEGNLRIFLDDCRQEFDGWVLCRTASDVIRILMEHNGNVQEISLDHDLGDSCQGEIGTHVVNFIEEWVFEDKMINPPVIHVHSANPDGRKNMIAGVQSIQRFLDEKGIDKDILGNWFDPDPFGNNHTVIEKIRRRK